jgi:hypothetical protein
MDLLLLACSATKRPDPQRLPAIDRSDGPFWRTLRHHLAQDQTLVNRLDVFALSAEFGVIPALQPIPASDRRLDQAGADAIREQRRGFAAREARSICQHDTRILIAGGQHDQAILPPEVLLTLRRTGQVLRTSGGIGQQLAQRKHWLHGSLTLPHRHVSSKKALAYSAIMCYHVVEAVCMHDHTSHWRY